MLFPKMMHDSVVANVCQRIHRNVCQSIQDVGADNVVNVFQFYNVFEADVLKALRRIKHNAEGIDGITIKFFKSIYPYISRHILHFINCIFTTSTIPNAWKVARVVPVPNFQPISIWTFSLYFLTSLTIKN